MRYPPLLIALFTALLLKPFTQGADILPGSFLVMLVFATLIYAFRHTRSLALVMAVLGVATVTLRLLADQRRLPTLELLSQGLSFIAMVVAMVAMLSEVLRARSASSDLVMGAVCLYLIIGLAWTFFTIQSTCFRQPQFSFHRTPRYAPLRVLRRNLRKCSTSASRR